MQGPPPCWVSTGNPSVEEIWDDKVELRYRYLQKVQELQHQRKVFQTENGRRELENKRLKDEKKTLSQLLEKEQNENFDQRRQLHMQQKQINELRIKEAHLQTQNDQLRKHNHILEKTVSLLKAQTDQYRPPPLRRRSRRFETVNRTLECQRCQQVLTEDEAENGACCYHPQKPLHHKQWRLIFNDSSLVSDVSRHNDKYYICCERWAKTKPPPGCKCVPRHVVQGNGW